MKRIHPVQVCLVCHDGICVDCGSCCGAPICAEACGAFIFANKTTLRKAAQRERLDQ